jgi:hypothetical protein
MKAALMKSSMVAVVTTPEQFSAMVAETGTIYRSIIESANIQIE